MSEPWGAWCWCSVPAWGFLLCLSNALAQPVRAETAYLKSLKTKELFVLAVGFSRSLHRAWGGAQPQKKDYSWMQSVQIFLSKCSEHIHGSALFS